MEPSLHPHTSTPRQCACRKGAQRPHRNIIMAGDNSGRPRETEAEMLVISSSEQSEVVSFVGKKEVMARSCRRDIFKCSRRKKNPASFSLDSHCGGGGNGRGFGSLTVVAAAAECSSSYEQLYYCYYKHVNGCFYMLDVLCRHQSPPLLHSFRHLSSSSPAASSWIWWFFPLSSSSRSLHRALIPLVPSRRPPRLPVVSTHSAVSSVFITLIIAQMAGVGRGALFGSTVLQ